MCGFTPTVGSNPTTTAVSSLSGHGNLRTPQGFGGFVVFLGLVVAAGVDEEFAGGGVGDSGVEVGDEQDDVDPGVGSTTADVVESAADSEVTTPLWWPPV